MARLLQLRSRMVEFSTPTGDRSGRWGRATLVSAFAVAVGAAAACGGSTPTSPSSTPITIVGTGVTTYTYTQDVQSILASDCVSCHGANQQQAGYNFSNYAGVLRALTAGSDSSLLVRVTQPGGTMYSQLSGNRTQKIQIIYDWVINSHAAQ